MEKIVIKAAVVAAVGIGICSVMKCGINTAWL